MALEENRFFTKSFREVHFREETAERMRKIEAFNTTIWQDNTKKKFALYTVGIWFAKPNNVL